jgi:hypothetical protein
MRKRIYHNQLQPVMSRINFSLRPSPFPAPADANSKKTPAQAAWDSRLQLWLSRELPILLNHNLRAKPTQRDEEEIELLQQVVFAHLHRDGDLTSSDSARRELDSIVGGEFASRFVEDTMLFLRSPFNTLEGFDRAVQYTADGLPEPEPEYNSEEEASGSQEATGGVAGGNHEVLSVESDDEPSAAGDTPLDASPPATKKRKMDDTKAKQKGHVIDLDDEGGANSASSEEDVVIIGDDRDGL